MITKSKQLKNELLLIPKCSINPNSIALYNEVDWTVNKPEKKYNPELNAVLSSKAEHLQNYSRTAEGNVSTTAKRKMNKALNYLLLITNQKTVSDNYSGRKFKFKIAFITLTLPSKQLHDDNEIKNTCLNQLLIELKTHYKVKNYIWRAEKQKNNNIHFHILVDKFIPYQELRDRWNRIIEKLNYISNYRKEQINFHKNGFRPRPELYKTWPKQKQYQAYLRNSKIHWNSPNTTDIHSIQKIRNIKNYISKYLTKNEIQKKEQIDPKNNIAQQKGRIWSCNQNLMKAKGLNIIPNNEVQSEIEQLKKHPKAKIFKHPYFTIIFIPFSEIELKSNSQIFKLFSEYLLKIFDYNWQYSLSA